MQKFWVIRKQPYRENSALLTVLADNNRLTRCIARGGIKASEFQPFFGLLTLKKNLATVVTSISKDHLDWLPKNEQTIEKIVFEKTSSLLNSNIVVSKQNSINTTECIKKTILKNSSKKLFFNEDFSYSNGENGFFYYEIK